MKAFDPNYKLLDEMYQDDYYPAFLVDKVKDELQKVIDLLESGETDTEEIQETREQNSGTAGRLVFVSKIPHCRKHRIRRGLPEAAERCTLDRMCQLLQLVPDPPSFPFPR